MCYLISQPCAIHHFLPQQLRRIKDQNIFSYKIQTIKTNIASKCVYYFYYSIFELKTCEPFFEIGFTFVMQIATKQYFQRNINSFSVFRIACCKNCLHFYGRENCVVRKYFVEEKVAIENHRRFQFLY